MVTPAHPSGRKWVYLLLLVVIATGAFLYLRGRQQSTAAGPATATLAGTHGHRHPPTPTPFPITSYARRIIPVLDRSTAMFDRAATAASRANLGNLGGVCARFSPKINLLTEQLDGIPHPYVWYSAVGRTHHTLIGIYHRMQGAMEVCRTAAGNADEQGALQSVADMGTAAHDLHRWSDSIHRQAASRR